MNDERQSGSSESEEASLWASPLLAPVRGWDRFWFGATDPTTLAFLRIAAGLLVFYVHLSYSWELLAYIGPDGWLSSAVGRYLCEGVPFYAPGWGWEDAPYVYAQGNWYWSVFYDVTDPGWLVAIHVGFLLVMLAYALGFCTRLTGILTWIAALSYVHRAQLTWFGLDTMMMIVLAYLQLGPTGATLSLDRWLEVRRARRAGLPAPPVEPSVSGNMAIRLIQVHFALIYFASGTTKLMGTTWWNATAPNYVLLNYSFGPFQFGPYSGFMAWLASHRWLWEIAMTGGVVYTILLELTLPLLIWDRRWRWFLMCASVFLHLMIGLFMGLTVFSLMMLVMLASFLPPEVVGRAIERGRERVAAMLRRSPAEPALSMSRP